MIWLVIGAVVLTAATWGVVIGLSWPIWIAVLVTATLVAILLIVIGARVIAPRGRRGRSNASEEQAQSRPSRPSPSAAPRSRSCTARSGGDQRPQRSKLGGGKRGADGALRAALVRDRRPARRRQDDRARHSGLVVPVPRSGRRRRPAGVGGTRNCDWWFTNEAILLDTAGRYTTEADDRDEWMAFLEHAQDYRPEKPINGVLVAVAMRRSDRRNADADRGARQEVRARIDEMQRRLQMILPVYVLFTKIDLVAGFVEFFGDLPKASARRRGAPRSTPTRRSSASPPWP